MTISGSVILRMTDVSDKSCREILNTRFIVSIFLPENRVVYEIMWRNTVQLGTPQTPI
jgi:hypothetical protein